MKVSSTIAAALLICLLGADGEAGSQSLPPEAQSATQTPESMQTPEPKPTQTPAPEQTPASKPTPTPPLSAPEETPRLAKVSTPLGASGQILPEPQLALLQSLIRRQGKATQTLEEEVRTIQRYVTGGLVALPFLLLMTLGLFIATLRRQDASELDAVKIQRWLQDLESQVTSASKELGRRIEAVKEASCPNEQLGTLGEKLTELEERISKMPSAPLNFSGDLASFKNSVDERVSAIEAAQNGLRPVAGPIPLEREVLREAWNKFRENKDVMAALARARDENWKEIHEPLLRYLPQFVPEDLKPSFEAAVASVKDFHALTSKIGLVEQLVDGRIPPLPSDAQELMRLRELTSLLTMIQTSNLVADRLNFRLEPWIADSFLGFADLFLQRYQRAQMENREGQLHLGHEIVCQILKIADLEPVDLKLGVTHFDSARHIGRSTASDPSVESGVILGVIRNGFIRGGQQVIRQPEVIVNRTA